jgi:uncharacterized protein
MRASHVFSGAAAVAALHVLDGALLHRWDGESVGRGAPAAILAVLFAGAATFLWPRLPRGTRALTALVAALITLVAGALSVATVAAGSGEGGAWSGLLLVPAGAAMLACAADAMRHAPRRSRPERWARRAAGVVAVALSLMWIVMPVAVALVAEGGPRRAVRADALAIPHEDVGFRSSDGLRLTGWYVPSRNGAAIVVVHGGGGDRAGGVRHARMLARHGYGVLLYDARGRGGSEGRPDAIGWTWQRDLAGALRWLARRSDVDPDRIGGLGLSTGAETLLQAAAERDDLRAVVADGAAGRSLREATRVVDAPDTPYWAALYAATRILTASSTPPDLGRLVRRLRAPALLIAAGRSEEADFNRIYAERSGGRARLWHVPDAGHTRALRRHPAAYEARVAAFLDAALTAGAPAEYTAGGAG